MAGLSTKDIKLRIKSMESTKQITKAMEMVAASKLRRAQERALESRPYFEILYNTYTDIAEKNRVFDSPYFQEREAKNICYVVIAGDRGLAGGLPRPMQRPHRFPSATVLPLPTCLRRTSKRKNMTGSASPIPTFCRSCPRLP